MIANKQQFAVEFIEGIIKLLIAGIIIGVLRPHDGFIAFLLGLKVIFNIYYNVIKPNKEDKNWILLAGMIITGIGGIIGEIWGVTNGYWVYELSHRELPLWLPFAWMLAFYFLYKLECKLIPTLKHPNQKNKVVLAIILALIFPAFGEMVTIQMGVWVYFWPYQLFGVPLYAFLCLVGLHMLIYLILHQVCLKYNIKDIVYN